MTTSTFDAGRPIGPGAPVLVVGGRGFVGSHVVRELVRCGYSVDVFGPQMSTDLIADVRHEIRDTMGSIEDGAALDAVFASVRPTAVVNCAGFGEGTAGLMRSGEADADRAFAINVDGFRRLIDGAARHGVNRIVWTSSTVVYGPASDYSGSPVDEASPKGPETIYGLTKHLSEELAICLAKRHGLGICGLRLPLVLGPGLWYQGAAAALMALLRAAKADEDHEIAFHDTLMDLMHVEDVARAAVAVLEAKAAINAVYNINGFTARASDMVRAVAARRPGRRYALDLIPTAMQFPLITDAMFRRQFACYPRYDLDGLVDAMLGSATE